MHLLDVQEWKKSHKYSRDHRQGSPNSMNLHLFRHCKFIYELFFRFNLGFSHNEVFEKASQIFRNCCKKSSSKSRTICSQATSRCSGGPSFIRCSKTQHSPSRKSDIISIAGSSSNSDSSPLNWGTVPAIKYERL